LLLPLDHEILRIELRGLHFSQEYRAPAAVARVSEVHAHIFPFQEFFVTTPGILQETGHDADTAHIVADLEDLAFLQEYLLRVYVDGAPGCRLAVKRSGQVGIGHGFEGLATLGDLDLEPVALVERETMSRFAPIRTKMPLPDAG